MTKPGIWKSKIENENVHRKMTRWFLNRYFPLFRWKALFKNSFPYIPVFGSIRKNESKRKLSLVN